MPTGKPPTLHFIGSTTATTQIADMHEHDQLKAEIRKAEHHFEKEAAQTDVLAATRFVRLFGAEGASSSNGEAKDSKSDSLDYEGMGTLALSSSDSEDDIAFQARIAYQTRVGFREPQPETTLNQTPGATPRATPRFLQARLNPPAAKPTRADGNQSHHEKAFAVYTAKCSQRAKDQYVLEAVLRVENYMARNHSPGKRPVKRWGNLAEFKLMGHKKYHDEQALKHAKKMHRVTPGATPRATPRFLQARLNPPAAKPTRADGNQSHHEKAFAVYTAKCSQRAKDQYVLEAVLRVENYMARNHSPGKRPVKRWGNLAEFKLMGHKKYHDEQALKHAKKMHRVQAFKNRSLKHVKAMHQECDSSTKVFII